MVQVRLEVRIGAARFRVSVRARSAQRAVSLAGARYAAGEVRIISCVEPMFARASARANVVETPARAAA